MLAAACCALLLWPAGMSARGAERQRLSGHVPGGARHWAALGRLPGTNRLELTIGLPLRNREALRDLLEKIYDPFHPEYQHYLAPAEFVERFGPSRQDYEAVIAFARARGLRITATHPNRMLLNVSGAVADIERAFRVRMQSYRHPTEARNFYAPDAEPSLDLQTRVLMIDGLDNFSRPRPANLRWVPQGRGAGADSGARPAGAGSGPRGFLLGRDFRAAYAPGVGLDGAGEAVGLLALDGFYTHDVLAYQNLAGLPHVPVTSVLVDGFNGRPGAGNIEVALDIAMASSMAPGLSQIIVYAGRPTSSPCTVLNRMANDTNHLGQVAARQLSSSWIWRTPSLELENQIFLQFAAQGQSFFQASGDDGAYCGAASPPWAPTDNPNVTVVGGTQLTTQSPGGAWAGETCWSYFPDEPVASGGGFGTNHALPGYQTGIDLAARGGSDTWRNSPDVACVAADIWLIANNGEQFSGAGTSAAAPLWAGFAALANQQAAARGLPALGFINPALYRIGKSSEYAAAFHDTTTGNNTNNCCGPDRFPAGPGYDLCTGWGTPTGSNLIAALLAPPPALRVTPAALPAFSGPLGGPFRPAAQGFTLTNDSHAALAWSVTHAAPWLHVSPASGILTHGGPAASVTLTPTAAADSLPVGSYVATLWFTNVNTTNAADEFSQSRLVSLDVVAPPVIAAQPTNQTVFEDMTAVFTVVPANGASCAYQWQYDNGVYLTNLTDGGRVSGSASSSLVIAHAAPADAGAYSVIVSNAAGAVASVPAFLAVFPWRPVIMTPPAGRSVVAGETVTFSVEAVGGQPLFYSWQRNGTALSDGRQVSGSHTPHLTLHCVSPADAAAYSVVVTNADGMAASPGAVLTVASITPPQTALTTIYSFTGGSDGANPNALRQGANGSFYGTAQNGGAHGAGLVFQLSPAGLVQPLYSFTGGDDGATPFGALAPGPEGDFYGSTYQGGAHDNGTLFRLTPGGGLTTLVAFNITNGSLPCAGLAPGADGNFYGSTYQGGAHGRGTAFKVTPAGALTTLRAFSNGADGGHLAAGLVRARDHTFYGATYKGGASGHGTVFQITADGGFKSLASFGQTNGANPLAELIQDPAGNFYGTTSAGGAHRHGTVFRLSPDGALHPLHSFSGGADGGYPAAALLLGGDGNFYGTTAYGGDYGAGTVFRLAPDGTLTTLVAFNGYAGANPQAALAEDDDGLLYGTTQNGGEYGLGTLFHLGFSGPLQITDPPASQLAYQGETVVLSVAVSGARPFSYQWRKDGASLPDATDRVLILAGVTTNDSGSYTVQAANPAGATNSSAALLQVLSAPPIIVHAPAPVTPAACSTVTFAATAAGDLPLAYQWQKDGASLADTCHRFGATTPSLVISNVTEADNGLYTLVVSNSLGVASASAWLTLVPASAPGTSLTTRHWFGGGLDGGEPDGLAPAGPDLFYGTTRAGGDWNQGTVFACDIHGACVRLASFAGTNGSSPRAAPVPGADGRYYGTTFQGGAHDQGTVFALTPAGALHTLHAFTAADDGAHPAAGLLAGDDGSFYGTASAGGAFGYGSVFRITTNGAFTTLHAFTGGLDGKSPAGALVRGADGGLYGLTPAGGAFDQGCFFRITAAGELTPLYSFTGGRDGSSPVGTLALGSDGNFYGCTETGGLGWSGTVFQITPAGALTTLHPFGDLLLKDGVRPAAGVMQSCDGNFYGTTRTDYLGGYGTVFRVSPNGGVFTTLLYFDGCNDGALPRAALIEDAAGHLYGTTACGGPCYAGQGTLFRLSFDGAPAITTQPACQAVVPGACAQFSVAVTGARPLVYQWQRNGTNLWDDANISGSAQRNLILHSASPADAGLYRVTLTNAFGAVTSAVARLTVVPPPVFLSAARSNSTLALTWSAIPGQQYRLQQRPGLEAAAWTNLGKIVVPTSNTVTLTDNVGSLSRRFYRVVLLPQGP